MLARPDAPLLPSDRAELIVRLRWFVELRWVFGLTVVAIGVLLRYVPLGEVNATRLAVVGLGILIYNSVFWLLEKWLIRFDPAAHADHAKLAALSQIVLDLIALTVTLHTAGGIESPFFLFYVFHIVIATLLLSMRSVFAVACLAIVLFSGLAVSEMTGRLPHHALFDRDGLYTSVQFVSITLVTFASALLIAVHFGTSIARQLRSREGEVIRLEEELARRAAELEHANEALRKADASKTQYFRKVSHDLKEPLAAQQSLLRVLLIELKDLPPASRKRIERAVARGDELIALVHDLLLLSRTRDGDLPERREWVNPLATIQGVLEDQAVRARDKKLDWRVVAPRELPAVYVEPVLLATLVENIVSNAVKYTPQGGQVTFTLDCNQPNLVMRMQDTGIGIKPEDLDRIGEEFFRTSQARGSGSSGTGLGMAIVRSGVDRLNGRLEIESQPNAGTTVTISLPVLAEQDGQPAGTGAPA